MTIQIKYFASLRERLGREQDELTVDKALSVSELWQGLNPGARPPNILCAINMEYASWSDMVNPDDEVAFFPPVTGG